MSPHCTTGERARWGSCLYSTLQVKGRGGGSCLHTILQVRGRGGGHDSIAHYRSEGEVGVISL